MSFYFGRPSRNDFGGGTIDHWIEHFLCNEDRKEEAYRTASYFEYLAWKAIQRQFQSPETIDPSTQEDTYAAIEHYFSSLSDDEMQEASLELAYRLADQGAAWSVILRQVDQLERSMVPVWER